MSTFSQSFMVLLSLLLLSPTELAWGNKESHSVLNEFEKTCAVDSETRSEDTMKNFHCITEITHQIQALMTQGNSPEALKVAKFGMTYFPFDSRISNLYTQSLDVFKSVTLKMSDCEVVLQRLALLSIVSPDTELKSLCGKPPVASGPVDKRQAIDFLKQHIIEKTDPGLEIKEFQNVSSMLKYQIAKNNENNVPEILYQGITAWDGLEFTALSLEVGKDAVSEKSFDLDIIFATNFTPRVNESCKTLSENFNLSGGTSIDCVGINPTTKVYNYYPLKLGKSDIEILTKGSVSQHLLNLTPVLFVFRIDFHSPTGKKSYYYLWANNEQIPNRSLYHHAFDIPNSHLFSLQPSVHTDPKVEIKAHDETEVKGKGLRLVFRHLDVKEFGEVTSATIHYDPNLTMALYQRLLSSSDPVRKVWPSMFSKVSVNNSSASELKIKN